MKFDSFDSLDSFDSFDSFDSLVDVCFLFNLLIFFFLDWLLRFILSSGTPVQDPHQLESLS